LLVETELRRFAEAAEPTSREGRRQYRMSIASVTSGRDSGFGLRALEEWFLQRTGQAISPVARLLAMAGQLTPGELRRHLVLHVATPEIADGLEQWPQTRAFIAERLGPTALAISEENQASLCERLRELGLNLEEGK